MVERSRKCREASADREAGVVFRLIRKEHHPGLRRLLWLRDIFFDDASLPSSRSCEEGNNALPNIRTFFSQPHRPRLHSHKLRPKPSAKSQKTLIVP